jgi:hypothetical protein
MAAVLSNIANATHIFATTLISLPSELSPNAGSTATNSDIPMLQCYAGPYGTTGFLLHLYTYYTLIRIIYYRQHSKIATRILRIFHGPDTPALSNELHRHRTNAFLCLLFGFGCCAIQGVAIFTCPLEQKGDDYRLLGYFIVGGMFPVTAGVLLAGTCLRMDRHTRDMLWVGSRGGQAEAWIVFAYAVALGSGLTNVHNMARESWSDWAMPLTCFGTLALVCIVVIVLGCILAVESDCDALTRGLGRGAGARLLAWVLWSLVASAIITPLLMDAVLAIRVPEDHSGLPLGQSKTIVGFWVGYVVSFGLPMFCT